MSNSELVTYTNLTSKHYGERKVKGVTIHCYVGQVTAKQGVDYLTNTPRQASANDVVGRDVSIGLCVEEKYGAFTSSSKKNDYTDGMVTIEVACNPKYPYDITRQAYEALVNLVTDICKRNKINKLVWSNNKSDRVNKTNGCNMSMHRDFAATVCPGDYIISKLPKIATEVNSRLGTTTQTTIELENHGVIVRHRLELIRFLLMLRKLVRMVTQCLTLKERLFIQILQVRATKILLKKLFQVSGATVQNVRSVLLRQDMIIQLYRVLLIIC